MMVRLSIYRGVLVYTFIYNYITPLFLHEKPIQTKKEIVVF
jgi:hypothetical protein